MKIRDRFLVGIFLLASATGFASDVTQSCPQKKELTSEKGKPLTFCNSGQYLVTEACFKKGSECKLLKDLKKAKPAPIKNFSEAGNPGIRKCHALKWKVLNAKMFDGSGVCICEHPSGDSVICTTL